MSAQFPDEQSPSGEFKRQEDEFRSWVMADSPSPYKAESGRYHLYISLACPWASRTYIALKLMGLDSKIGVSVVDPIRDERGWAFRQGPGCGLDPVSGFSFLSEAYEASKPGYKGRVTVPVLWDKQTRRIVNNSEDDICRMFNDAFGGSAVMDWFPPDIAGEQQKLSNFVYDHVNNGVYKAGFATSQTAYEKAVRSVFSALDILEERLSSQRFLFGRRIVETDWRLFCTLVRFDAVYHGHFKCNLRRIVDYPNLWSYLRDLYQQPGVAPTVDFDHIKRHYYMTHLEINPTGIVPLGPLLNLEQPVNRQALG
ncbi:MAG TPA: glutathione S-transferase family protein [Verrucomicrobiae bacterium]|nr:glutathione S-transferase family protein [Verrucomicrobiae bacterium]